MANMAQAIRLALHFAEENYELKEIFGQDVGAPLGGVFTATQGLKTAWNTPLDERGIVSTAIGLALAGSRCVAEIQFCDYIYNTIDLLKIAGNTLWCSGGQMPVPLVLMTPVGAGIRGSIYHSHSFESMAAQIPGWKIVCPADPLEAYGLMLSAILDPNPVLFLKPKALMRVKGKELIPGEPSDEKTLKEMIDAPIGDRSGWSPNWPPVGEHLIPIGPAQVRQMGDQLTVVTYGRYVEQVEEALRAMGSDAPSVEIINLRSLFPYDWQTIKHSVLKTRRLLVVNEDKDFVNFGEHLAYRATSELFYSLYAPPQLLAGQNVPGIGLHPNLEAASVPQQKDIQYAIAKAVSEAP